jgi:hypothetical protein
VVCALAMMGCEAGGGATDGGITCGTLDMCARVPLAAVKAACGTTATTVSRTHEASGAFTTFGCSYEISGGVSVFEVTRACFFTGATGARSEFDELSLVSGVGASSKEDLTGLGDAASFAYAAGPPATARLEALAGNTVVELRDEEAGDLADTKACLQTIARTAGVGP